MKKDLSLIVFQNLNCVGCRFANEKKVGTGEPCCTYWQQITVVGGYCETRKQVAQPGTVDNK